MKNDGNDVTNTCLAGAALYNLEYVEQKQQSEEKRSPAQAVTIPKRPSLQPAPAAAPAQPGTRPGGQPRAHLMAQRPCRWPALLLCSETRQAMRAPHVQRQSADQAQPGGGPPAWTARRRTRQTLIKFWTVSAKMEEAGMSKSARPRSSNAYERVAIVELIKDHIEQRDGHRELHKGARQSQIAHQFIHQRIRGRHRRKRTMCAAPHVAEKARLRPRARHPRR